MCGLNHTPPCHTHLADDEALALADAVDVVVEDGDGEPVLEADGVYVTELLAEPEAEAVTDVDADCDSAGVGEADAVIDAEPDTLLVADRDVEGDGETVHVALPLTLLDTDGVTLVELEAEGVTLGLVLRLALADSHTPDDVLTSTKSTPMAP